MQISSGNNLPRAKVSNQTAIKDIIYHLGPIYRSEVADYLSLTLPTITTTTKLLMSKGLIKQLPFVETENKNVGRRANLIDIDADSQFFLGLEIRGSQRSVCVTNFRGKVLCSAIDDTPLTSYEESIRAAAVLVDRLLTQNDFPKSKLSRVGICLPGLVDVENGILDNHPGYGWKEKNVVRDLNGLLKLNIPVHIENNARARATAMRYFHQDQLKGADTFTYFFVSLGIACPYVTNEIGRPTHFLGLGEVGHVVVDPHGPKCSCGNHGCLEALSSEKAIIAACAAALAEGKAPVLAQRCKQPEAPTIEEILSAQSQGDPAVCGIIESAVANMAMVIANLYNFVSPRRMVIECALLREEANRRLLLDVVEKNVYSATVSETHFTFVEKNDLTGALGAAAVAIQNEIFSFTE